MPAGYAPLPNPRSEPGAEHEMDDAFESDQEDDEQQLSEYAPLTRSQHARTGPSPAPIAIPGIYDFERDRDYDYPPPPGSPPGPSARAFSNDWGNSNGLLPTAPALPREPRPSLFRRAVGALLPQHYSRVATEPTIARPRGGGTENDGVFANVMAKPGRAVAVTGENGEVYMVPEESQNEAPPTYVEAQADAVPTYWETTVHAPMALEPGADMIVDDLPTGSILFFVITAFISYFFQFIGFVLTYLLHTTHAAKFGSRAGLGLTMIQYGFYSRNTQIMEEEAGQQETLLWNRTMGLGAGSMAGSQPDGTLFPNGTFIDADQEQEYGITTRDWLSLLLMTLGWFLLLSSIIGFYRVKRWELSIRSAAAPTPRTPEQLQREAEVRLNIERVFGVLDFEEDANENERRRAETPVLSGPEARLRHDLRAAGFL